MSTPGLSSIRNALTSLNPKSVKEASEKPVHLNIHAADADAYHRVESFLLQELQQERRRESAALISRGTPPVRGSAEIIQIYDESVAAPHKSLVFRASAPQQMVEAALKQYENEAMALSRYFLPFRKPFITQAIARTCRENTLFSLTTALPDVIPSFIQLPWSVAEFASDTAFLTMNQVRMAFQIAGASDRDIGYLEQKSEIAAVIGSAFGWRALARQLIGKIPFGGGLIAKAGVAYAGTKVLGLSLDRYYGTGFTYTRDERKHMYNDAFEQGKKIAQRMVQTLRPGVPLKSSK